MYFFSQNVFKNHLGYHFTATRIAIKEKKREINLGKYVEKLGVLICCW